MRCILKTFLTHPRFRELIETAKKMIEESYERDDTFQLIASFSVDALKDLSKLELLPLPVTIEKHPEITETDEDIIVFRWFTCDGPEQAKEVMSFITKFFNAMLKALDDYTPAPSDNSVKSDNTANTANSVKSNKNGKNGKKSS